MGKGRETSDFGVPGCDSLPVAPDLGMTRANPQSGFVVRCPAWAISPSRTVPDSVRKLSQWDTSGREHAQNLTIV